MTPALYRRRIAAIGKALKAGDEDECTQLFQEYLEMALPDPIHRNPWLLAPIPYKCCVAILAHSISPKRAMVVLTRGGEAKGVPTSFQYSFARVKRRIQNQEPILTVSNRPRQKLVSTKRGFWYFMWEMMYELESEAAFTSTPELVRAYSQYVYGMESEPEKDFPRIDAGKEQFLINAYPTKEWVVSVADRQKKVLSTSDESDDSPPTPPPAPTVRIPKRMRSTSPSKCASSVRPVAPRVKSDDDSPPPPPPATPPPKRSKKREKVDRLGGGDLSTSKHRMRPAEKPLEIAMATPVPDIRAEGLPTEEIVSKTREGMEEISLDSDWFIDGDALLYLPPPSPLCSEWGSLKDLPIDDLLKEFDFHRDLVNS